MRPLLFSLLVLSPLAVAAQVAPKPREAERQWVPVTKQLIERDDQVAGDALHRDFPDSVIDARGRVWVSFIEHDGAQDVLVLAHTEGDGLRRVGEVSSPGVLHQPAIALDAEGGVWCFWGQVNEATVVSLRGRRYFDSRFGEEIELASSPEAGHSFADAGRDAEGNVWVVWQEIRPAASRIWSRIWETEKGAWREAVSISGTEPGGHWEPRLAFTREPGAWVVYDSSAGSEFNLQLARVEPEGRVVRHRLTESPEFEGRASISASPDGSLWIAAERGKRQWGLDSRGHANETGLNAGKRLLLGRFVPADGSFAEVPVFDRGRPTPAPHPTPGFAVNLPSVLATPGGIWISYRCYVGLNWEIALLRYDPQREIWSEPLAVENSTMGQDRRQELKLDPRGELWLTWASDHRVTKECLTAGVHLARIETGSPWPELPPSQTTAVAMREAPKPYLNEPTPPRPLDEHHRWTINGKTYRLCWGDLHRHTDISNCRTGFDGCVVDAYRYAYDMAGLDFLGTSDHTDVKKKYDPYEWWHTQRQVDVFHAPGSFASLYAYEREQRFPWGHRNIVFAQRGGPVIYINRNLYRSSPWQARYPVKPGLGEIHPTEVWDLVKRYGKPTAIISHTGATNMGTDWTRYEGPVDNTNENLVELFQGARVSYEGQGLPQPTVGLRVGENYTPHRLAGDEHPAPPGPILDFEAGVKDAPAYNKGTYQMALGEGHKLGVFASSDHIATHTSFGGVYVEEFTREGLIEGFNARRTCAATDKIFIQLHCGEHLMGEAFETSEAPTLELLVAGTAPLKRVTIVRNEQNHHVIEPEAGAVTLDLKWTDLEPVDGENRYYLRIEQVDGNMGWSSPLWITRVD